MKTLKGISARDMKPPNFVSQMKSAFKASVLYKHINSVTQKRETDIGNGV